LELNPWVSHITSRYTRLLQDSKEGATDAAVSSKKKKQKGSLSVVHLTANESLEEFEKERDEEDANQESNDDEEGNDPKK
jgi:hypothetical protein